MKTNNTRRQMELRRMLKNADVELTVENQKTNTHVFYKNADVELDLEPGEIGFVELCEAVKIDKKFFSEHWLTVVDFWTSDKELMDNITIDDIRLYMNISNATFKDNEYYFDLLQSDIDTVRDELSYLSNIEKRELGTIAVEFYRRDLLTDYKVIQLLEREIPHLYFDEFN